jgi:hypothetical protein
MNQNSTVGARARRGAGHEPRRKRAREDRMTASKATPKVPATVYKPTTQEAAALEAQQARRQKENSAPRVKIEMKAGVAHLSFDHDDQGIAGTLVMEAIGTADFEFVEGLLGHLANVAKQRNAVEAKDLNFLLAVVKGIEPRDQIEAMLAAQMAAVHNATMTFARRLNHVDNIPKQDSAERAFNKLARTFTAQVEALKRYRNAGEQTVRVEHVTVNEGGQAVVGNVTHGGGAASKKPGATS